MEASVLPLHKKKFVNWHMVMQWQFQIFITELVYHKYVIHWLAKLISETSYWERTSQPTSLNIATSFNWNFLEKVMDPYKFYCRDIYNGDRMCIKTMQGLDRIIARIPVKQAVSLISLERWTLISIAFAIISIINIIFPIFVFLKKILGILHYKWSIWMIWFG